MAGSPLGSATGAVGGTGLGLQGVGLAGSAIAAYGQYQAQQGISQSSQNIAALQQQQNAISWNQQQLASRRNSLQELRNAQQSRATATAAATNQGGLFGSGLGGGLGNISGEEIGNLSSISENLQLGKQSYDVNTTISGQEENIAKYQGAAAMWSGLGGASSGTSSLGTSMVSAATNASGSLFF